ncbi:MAG: hypothetical protein ABJB09_00465 [Verrucomicrobiota bacterium]
MTILWNAAFCFTVLGVLTNVARSQSSTPEPVAVRVTVSLNADGSRTVYEFDSLRHKATATTTGTDGKTVGKIRYVLDDAGRFANGEIFGPDEQFRFNALYKYDAAGRLSQEIQMNKEGALQNKIVYDYDKNGKQTGYAVYDAAGKLIRQTSPLSATPTPPTRKKK